MLFIISETIPQKLNIQSMLMTGFIRWIATPTDQTKSNPLANQEESSITKSLVSFYSFPVSSRGVLAVKELPAFKYGTKINKDNKSAS